MSAGISHSLEKINCPAEFVSKDACHSTDPSNWFPLSTATVEYWLEHGPDTCRNESSANDYPASVRSYNPTAKAPKGRRRCFSSRLFYATAPNGEKQSFDFDGCCIAQAEAQCIVFIALRCIAVRIAFRNWTASADGSTAMQLPNMNRAQVIEKTFSKLVLDAPTTLVLTAVLHYRFRNRNNTGLMCFGVL